MESVLSKGEKYFVQIIDAAYDLSLSRGFHGSPVRQIADRAGIALGGIYNHFSSKNGIIEAVFLASHPTERSPNYCVKSKPIPSKTCLHRVFRTGPRSFSQAQQYPQAYPGLDTCQAADRLTGKRVDHELPLQ